MKTSQSILESLSRSTPFHALQKHRCYRKFLTLLPPRFRDAIAFIYVREAVLHIALRHPGYKMELDYNKELLKSLLETLTTSDKACHHLQADRVILFNSRYVSASTPDSSETVPHYHELADGSFEDHTTHPDLRAQFKRLRHIIRTHRHSHA